MEKEKLYSGILRFLKLFFGTTLYLGGLVLGMWVFGKISGDLYQSGFMWFYLIGSCLFYIYYKNKNSFTKAGFQELKEKIKIALKQFLYFCYGFGVLVLIGWGVSELFADDSSSEVKPYNANTYTPASTNTYYPTPNYYSSYNNYSNSRYYQEPENPYDEGSGHSAGYEWAEENDVSSCGGNSNSFIEGCEEYLSQQEETQEDGDY